MKASKHQEITSSHEFIFVFKPYFIRDNIIKKIQKWGISNKDEWNGGGGCGGGGVALSSQYQSPPSAGGQLLVPKFEKGGRVRKEMNYRF